MRNHVQHVAAMKAHRVLEVVLGQRKRLAGFVPSQAQRGL